MNPLLEQLHDIEELDPIHWWPLPIGWLFISVLVFIFSIVVMFWISKWLKFRRSWKRDFLIQLREIEKNLSEKNGSESITLLSQLMRRMVLRLFSRNECAALTGREWLQWLTEHDPKQFNWNEKGKALIRAPYAPFCENQEEMSPREMKEMIRAMKRWIH